METEIITLEDGNTYYIIDEINNYVYLSNQNDPEDMAIRKSIIEDGKEFISTLDSKEEFEEALKLFNDKNEE